ncbi:flavodoxin family protein [Pseudonocardia alni subsp. carboxydivorans]|uniref:Flavodoxin n=1 Tax=Pseudonocardia alni subsp. carboxydivorans TaxID=415010 RepID=A0ABU9ALX8_PSEA5
MHVQIVVESLFGTTRAVAEAVADGLLARGCDVDVDPPDPSTPLRPGELLVVLGPTHAFGMTRPATREDAVRQGATAPPSDGIREWPDRLPDAGPDAPATVCADTRVSRWVPGSAAHAAARVLGRRGYRSAGAPRSFLVRGNGPLRPGELERAREWGAALLPATTRADGAR